MTALETRKISEGRWGVFHLPTGFPIGAPLHYGRNKKKDVIAFMNEALTLFPWQEWQKREDAPEWADRAYRWIKQYGMMPL